MTSAAAGKTDADEVADAVVYVRPSTWKRLNAKKDRGISFDDVIVSLLDESDEALAEDTR